MDTPVSLRGDIENAAVRLLEPLLRRPDGGYCSLIMPFGGELTPGRESDDWQRATQGAHPAMLIQSGDGAYENRTMGRNADYVLDLIVLIGTDNVRSQVAQTQGDSTGASVDPGIYSMIDDVRDRLFNRPLADVAGACTMRPINDGPVLRAPDRMIWGCLYQVRVDAVETGLEQFDGDYLILRSSINFPSTDPGAPANPLLEFEQTLSTP